MGVPPSVLPLTSVSEKILKLVIEYVNYHYKNWRDPDTKGPGLTDWELNLYKDLSNADLREFLQAANFLDIPDLVDSLARFFATKLVGKSYAEIKEMFEGSDDLDQ